MNDEIRKIIFTAHDSSGRHLLLAMLDYGIWAIVIDGQPLPQRWEHGQLALAAGAYRELLFNKPYPAE